MNTGVKILNRIANTIETYTQNIRLVSHLKSNHCNSANRIKEKDNRIIYQFAEKNILQNSTPFHDLKSLKKLEIEEQFL